MTEAGKHTLPVKIETPNGVTLEGTYPESITVYLDTRTSVQVPVEVKLSNYTIPNDCVIESSAMVPNITVSGPDEELAKIKTARISLEPGVLNGSVTISGKPVLLDEAGNEVSNPYIKMTPTDVEVRLELQTYKEIPINVSYKYGCLLYTSPSPRDRG